jgi:hypothetical protein
MLLHATATAKAAVAAAVACGMLAGLCVLGGAYVSVSCILVRHHYTINHFGKASAQCVNGTQAQAVTCWSRFISGCE